MHHILFLSALAAFTATATSQVIGIDDLNPATGTSNAFPWSLTGGQTSLHVYSAATLHSLGVCAGAVLLDLEIAPSSGTAGVYNAPQAKLEIGHLAASPPIPGNWTGHLASPIVIHDVTSGAYTFPWAINTHVSLPGFSTAGFVWDGINDVGIQYTSSPGVTGGFNARRSATQLRHYVAIFAATTQAPTSNGLFAMEVKMTWAPGAGCAARTAYGTGCDSPALTLNSNFPVLGSNFVLTTTNVPNLVPLAVMFFGDVQVLPGIDLGFLGAPGCSGYTNGNLTSSTFAVVAGTGVQPLAIPNNILLVGMTLTSQSVAFTLSNALGLSTSNGLLWTVGF